MKRKIITDEFEKHWDAWRFAFSPHDKNAKRVVLNAFNEGKAALAKELYESMTGIRRDLVTIPNIIRFLEGHMKVEEQEK